MDNKPILLTSEEIEQKKQMQPQLEADIVKSRFMELLELVQGQMAQKHTGEQAMMLAMGMGMLIQGVQGQDSLKLKEWLNSLEEILLAVGKWDLPQEEYEAEVEQHLLGLLSIL